MKTNKLFFLFCILFSMLTTNALAYDFEAKNAKGVTIYYSYINNKTEVEVTQKNTYNNDSYRDSIFIPQEVIYNNKTLKVTSIGERAFMYCEDLEYVFIPNSVKSIGESAFMYCNSLDSITIPHSVKSIGDES